ncbi:MAG: DUF4843 domain-containing protein [Bacteroidales bacterium]|nr:DUF4843 domain-containing protein [Bacteroidales bacterium]MDD4639130.1 DUF4843 domain-containing protein [Bacteroidales bacterium]
MKKIAYILTSLLFVSACETVEMETFGDQKFVQFVDAYKDSTTLTFMFYPGQSTVDYPLQVKLLGRMDDKDINYKLRIVDKETTAPAAFYSIPEDQLLRKGKVTDTALVQFIKQPEMDAKAYRIVLEVIGTKDVSVGETIYCRKVFWVSNTIAQPEWWDATIVKSFLGAYSDLKFQEFIKIAGTADLTDKSWDERRALCLKFKYFLQQQADAGNPLKEIDGSDMTVPILG